MSIEIKNINIASVLLFFRKHKENGNTLPLRVKFFFFIKEWLPGYLIFVLHNFFSIILIFLSGPKPKTIADFWSMIWQEEVSNIVCLTNLKEGTKVTHILTFVIYRHIT